MSTTSSAVRSTRPCRSQCAPRDRPSGTPTGEAYLDAAGGAVVVGVGHGRESVARVMADQASRVAYAHGTAFTSERSSATRQPSRRTCPWTTRRSIPSPAARRRWNRRSSSFGAITWRAGETERWIVFARWGSYHGNTLGALDLSGRKPLRRPYEAWLGRFRHVSAAYPYRAGEPGANALGDADELAAELERAFEAAGPGTVAAFVAEPIVGATLAAAVPPEGYWPAIAEVCRRHGVLLVVDEVMTGFGRTGRWFGVDHWGIRPDILVGAKGGTSGYFPFGLVAASGAVAGRRPRRAAGLRPRLHLLPSRGGRGGCRRGPPHPRGRAPRRRQRGEGRSAAGAPSRPPRRPSQRRRDPWARPPDRAGARGGPRDARAIPARRPRDGGDPPRRARRPASCSIRARASRTARTATPSCSGRRSS